MRIATAKTTEDAALAGALIREYGERYAFDFTDPRWLAEIGDPAAKYATPDGCIVLAWMGEEPVGVVAIKRLDARTCVMKRMFVKPSFRRRGVGRCLALELLFEAERLGYGRMVLDTPRENGAALALYRSIGFTEGEPFMEPGHDHVHEDWAYLEIPLPPPDEVYFERSRVLLETAYLASSNVYGQSGHLGDAARWELKMRAVSDAIDRDGTFIDIGCANGLLMESVARWTGERYLKVEPYGLDISEKLADLARRRLPEWADRIFVGNAWTWEPPMTFDFLSTRVEYVPEARRPAFVQQLLERAVSPHGRLIVVGTGFRLGHYVPGVELLRDWGFAVGGELERRDSNGEPVSRAAWIDRE